MRAYCFSFGTLLFVIFPLDVVAFTVSVFVYVYARDVFIIRTGPGRPLSVFRRKTEANKKRTSTEHRISRAFVVRAVLLYAYHSFRLFDRQSGGCGIRWGVFCFVLRPVFTSQPICRPLGLNVGRPEFMNAITVDVLWAHKIG